jgi:hypothetical protein
MIADNSILVDHETDCIGKLIYLSMYMKNVQIRCHTCLVHQFEGKMVLDPEIDSKSDYAIPN